MIAVSSDTNNGSDLTKMARKSWAKSFDDFIVLHREYPPTIKSLVECINTRALQYWCLINADIVVSERLKEVEHQLQCGGAMCAVSRRFQFDPALPFPQKTSSVDLGMDCFIAAPQVWWLVQQNIPDHFLIGRPQWDTWLHGFLNHNFKDHYYDFSKWGCIFHPKHERKPWTGPVLPIPWEAKDLEPPQELPLEIPALTKASHAPAFT